MSNGKSSTIHIETNHKPTNSTPKPAVHRGFMARAKGIPALELYRLAQKKRRKLVLCGHSLGGAVAVLATLAILRVIAVTSTEKIQVKCITFSQPPVGNAALRDYVNGKGWHHYFKTYCIPEDLVPRILSPAYFHHYNSQNPTGPDVTETSPSVSKYGEGFEKQKANRLKENEGEQLVLGLGPVQNPFWRLSRLVPIEGLRRQFYNKGNRVEPIETAATDSAATSTIDDLVTTPQSLEIEEGSDGISLRPLPNKREDITGGLKNDKSSGASSSNGDKRRWRRIPSLPSYVPFGQLYLLGNSSVESLSGSEYSKLTSVRSVLAEVKERFQSHSMRSYRSRFQRIYEQYMNENAFSFLGEQDLQFPQLQKWLGISVAGTVELGHIVDSPMIRAATSLVPLGWTGIPSEKNGDPLKVDISGFGLHQCTLIQARVNGKWCSTTVESFPSPPAYSSQYELQPEMQRLRITIGAPLKRPPKHQIYDDTLMPAFLSIDPNSVDLKLKQSRSLEMEENFVHPDGLSEFVVFCTTDFSTVTKEVHVRTRRVRLIGIEGAGKTSLIKAILNQGRTTTTTSLDDFPMDIDVREGIAGGLLYSDSTGVNLQNLNLEASNFRDELWKGIRDLSHKTDLVVLVHNLSHRIPRYGQSNASPPPPALTLLLDEAKSVGIPWVLAITNKFSVSAHQQKTAINDVLQAYQASPMLTEVVNSCPYVMPSSVGDELSWRAEDTVPNRASVGRRLIFAPLNLVRRPFRKKPSVLPVEGVSSLCQLVHRVLRNDEEAALQELARDRILLELARERAAAGRADRDAAAKSNSLGAATVGASVGAGVGILLAVVMGAASALRKP
ncbi:uncharacterized protein LOC130999469 isoform X2 [Salvia miltiorrhiza]|nr:uncharacterized protein LOC130999469 isoform X2 [Salvia miltiorrhiza]